MGLLGLWTPAPSGPTIVLLFSSAQPLKPVAVASMLKYLSYVRERALSLPPQHGSPPRHWPSTLQSVKSAPHLQSCMGQTCAKAALAPQRFPSRF